MPLFDWIRSDLHSLNLDWIISKIKTVEESEQGAVDAAADANASKTAAAASATAANNSKTAAAGSATAAAGSAAQAQALVDQLDTTIAQDVSDWLENNLTPTSPPVDDTLTIQGAAADAKKTGDGLNELKTDLEHYYFINNYAVSYGGIYNGSINADTNRIHTDDMIRVHVGTIITTSANFANIWIAKYNLDKTYKSNGDWVSTFTSDFDGYIRVVMRKTASNAQITTDDFADIRSTVKVLYNYVGDYNDNYSKTEDSLSKANVLTELLNEYNYVASSDRTEALNLFNKDSAGVTTNGYYSRTNAFTSSTTLGSTDYIKVFYGFTYTTNLNAGGYVLWYDSDKSFLGYTDVAQNASFTPAYTNAAYMKCLIILADIDTYKIWCNKIQCISAEKGCYYGLNGVAFGTSLTYRALTTGGYLQYLPSLCGANIENKGLGNSTILNNGSNPDMMAVITGYADYLNKDFAIIEGFVNDWYNNSASLGTWKDTGTTSVCGCVRTALQYMLTQNPSLTVIMVIDPIGRSASGVDCSSLAVRNGITQSEFYDEISKVAESIGVPVIRCDKLSGMSENTPYMYIDNIHPNAEGAEQTANTIWSVMKNIPIKVIDE